MRYLTCALSLITFSALLAQDPPPVIFQTDRAGAVEIPPAAVLEVLKSLSPEKASALADYAGKIEAQRDEAALMGTLDTVRPLFPEMKDTERNELNLLVLSACERAKTAVLARREAARKQKEISDALARAQAGAAAKSASPSSATTPQR